MSNPKKFQSWNRRTQQWIYFENGQIRAVSSRKFSGVPVKKDKPGAGPAADPVKLPPADDENKWSLF